MDSEANLRMEHIEKDIDSLKNDMKEVAKKGDVDLVKKDLIGVVKSMRFWVVIVGGAVMGLMMAWLAWVSTVVIKQGQDLRGLQTEAELEKRIKRSKAPTSYYYD